MWFSAMGVHLAASSLARGMWLSAMGVHLADSNGQPRLALPRLVHAVGVRDLVCMRRALATKDVASARPLSMPSWLSQAVLSLHG